MECRRLAHHKSYLRYLALTLYSYSNHIDSSFSSVSWSPKGKQIAIGLESGDIVTFNPTDTSAVKSVVPKPQNLDGQSIISTTWLSNTEFHAIYAPVGQMSPDVEQSHYVLSLESKSSMAGDVKLACPSTAERVPGSKSGRRTTAAAKRTKACRRLDGSCTKGSKR